MRAPLIAAFVLAGCGGAWAPTYSLGRYPERRHALRERARDAIENEHLEITDDDEEGIVVRAPSGQGAIAIEVHQSGWLTLSPASPAARPLRGGWSAPPRLVRDHAEVAIRLRARLDRDALEARGGPRALGAPGGEVAPTDHANPRWSSHLDLGAGLVGAIGLGASWVLGIALGAVVAGDAPGDGCATQFQAWSSVPVIGGLGSAASLGGCGLMAPANAIATVSGIVHSALDVSFLVIGVLALVIPVTDVEVDGPRSPRIAIVPVPLADGAAISIAGATF